MDYITHYLSPLGRITIASDGENLIGLWFEQQKYYAAGLSEKREEKELPVFVQTKQWLDCYFRGEEPGFMPAITMRAGAFRKRVWEILLTIPYGSTMSYGEIAAILAKERNIAGMSAQAVGGAVGHNPISIIIPCHRVIGAEGKLTGYAGGLDRKMYLLRLEQAELADKRK